MFTMLYNIAGSPFPVLHTVKEHKTFPHSTHLNIFCGVSFNHKIWKNKPQAIISIFFTISNYKQKGDLL